MYTRARRTVKAVSSAEIEGPNGILLTGPAQTDKRRNIGAGRSLGLWFVHGPGVRVFGRPRVTTRGGDKKYILARQIKASRGRKCDRYVLLRGRSLLAERDLGKIDVGISYVFRTDGPRPQLFTLCRNQYRGGGGGSTHITSCSRCEKDEGRPDHGMVLQKDGIRWKVS